MSSPVVESVRTIPLIVEQGHRNIPMEVEENSGFPFDRDSDRDSHFRSQLDDLAKRHPEFAEHLGGFTRRHSPRRQSSLGGTEEPDLQRRFQRPFGGSRFERFGFPFDSDDFDPEQYAQQFYQPQQEFYQQQPTYHQPQSSYSQSQPEYHQADQNSQSQSTEQPPPEPDRSNIHQSNTVDLGQRQEPVNDRSQRSMSAPPPEKGQRFTSSINIPVNQPTDSENMPQTQPHQQAETKMTERIIPIHIEGRSEPVMPKTAPPTFSNSPQPEKIFGQRPENFTQFVNREPRQYEKWHPPHFDHHGLNHPEEFVRQQRFPQQQTAPTHFQQQQKPAPQQHQQQKPVPQQQQHAKDEIPIPVQVEVPHSKQQAPQQQQQQEDQVPSEPKPAPQQKKTLTPLDQIQAIQKDVLALMSQVEQFDGKFKDKQYLYLDEMFTRNLLKLDNIDTQGQDSIRSARKEAIKSIEKAIGVLESKATGKAEAPKPEETMEVEEKSHEVPALAPENEIVESEKKDEGLMEAEHATVAEAKDNKSDESQQQQQPMELVPENTTVVEASPQIEQNEESKPNTEEPKAEEKIDRNTAIPMPPPPAAATSVPPPVEDNVEAPVTNNTVEIVENKPAEASATVEEQKMDTCDSQENNLPVAEAVKKFEGNVEKKEEQKKEDDGKNKNDKPSENKESSQSQETSEVKVEDKKGEKKEKKKIKKKVEKKEK